MDVKQIQQITDRISQNLTSKGVSPDTQSIFDKLSAYINDFGVVASEAERKVLADQYKKYEIPEELKTTHQVTTSKNDVVCLADIQESDWVTVEVKVVARQPPNSPAISQNGTFADSTGAVRFVVFSKAANVPELELEKWYRIESAVVDSYHGALNLKIHSGSKITEISDDRCLVPPAPTPIASIKPGVVPCIHVKFIDEWESRSDRMLQNGIVADESGRTRFVIWADPDKEKLKIGSVYTIFYANVDEFNGRYSLSLNSAMWIEDDSSPLVPPLTPVSEIKPGIVPRIRVKFVDEWESRSERMMQTGLVADESGRIKFVLWNDPNKEKLKIGSVYTISYVGVDEFNGRCSLSLNSATITEEDDDSLQTVSVRTGSSVPTEPMPITKIHDLAAGYASLRVKFVEEWEPRSDKMMQSGLVGDESGKIKFVLWKDDAKQPLELGKIYNVVNAKVDEYNGRLSLLLNPATYSEDVGSEDFEVGTQMDEVVGALVQISKGSGLIKRCPVEGCGRSLSKQNLCPVHEIQNNYVYDMRIKAVVDNGYKACNVLIGRELTENLSGMTMDEAIDIGTSNPLGLDEVLVRISEHLCGKYIRCQGSMFDDHLMAKSVEFLKYDSSEVASLMNRAGATEKQEGVL